MYCWRRPESGDMAAAIQTARAAAPPYRTHAMKFGWKVLRIPGPVFLAAALVLAIDSAIPLLMWRFASTAPGHDVRAAAALSVGLTTVADIAVFVWLYFKLTRRYLQRLDAGVGAAMDAVICSGPDGQVVLFNPTAQAMFGYPADQILGRPLELLVPERHRAAHRRAIAEFAAGPSPNHVFGRRAGVVGLRADGTEFPVEGLITRVGKGADRLCTLILRDVSVRRETQVQVEQLAAIVESSDDAITSTDLDGTVLTWNAGAERMGGYTAAEMIGQSTLLLLPAERLDEERDIFERIRSGKPVRHFNSVRRRKDGTTFDVSVSVAPLRDEAGRVVGASRIARDISEQKNAERVQAEYVARLQELSRRLMETEEQERRRLANELHDRTGSNLTALGTTLAVMRSTMPPQVAREQAVRFSECDLMLRETMDHVRHVLADLRPTALDLGLLAALRDHAARLRVRTGLVIELKGSEPMPRPAPDAEISLFRIAQEAINNAAKHARGSAVEVLLSTHDGVLRLSVSDDGRGFDPAAGCAGSASLGMTTMRERAEAIRARLSVVSAPGAGTRVTVELELGRQGPVH
ncbi:MAG: hypothetical protein JWQ07_3469 [Ramlibacter sp.]|nr:hypothetical protein [Ramlibacter sp.]